MTGKWQAFPYHLRQHKASHEGVRDELNFQLSLFLCLKVEIFVKM